MRQKLTVLAVASLLFTAFVVVSLVADTGSKTYTGYLADNLCVRSGIAADGANMATNPEKHTVACALMKPCVASGYTLLMKNPSGKFDSYPLDDKGNTLAVSYLKKTKKTDNILVTISGTMKDNMLQVKSIEDAR
jgi:hypothetical protein